MRKVITFNELFEIFKNSKDVIIEEEQLIAFYGSIKKSVICLCARKYAFPKLLKLEEEDQWPVLRKIGDPRLDIYEDVDEKLLTMFINSIKNEEEIRSGKSKLSSDERIVAFRVWIQNRTELYAIIFKFTEKDIAYCEKAAEKYENKIIREKKKRIIKATETDAGAAAAKGQIITTGVKYEKGKENDKK